MIGRSHKNNIKKMCAIKLNAATSLANWQELTGVHQLLYFAHLLLLWYIQSQNIVCQCGEDVLMSSTLIPNLTSRCVPTVSGALKPTNINWLPVLSNIEPSPDLADLSWPRLHDSRVYPNGSAYMGAVVD